MRQPLKALACLLVLGLLGTLSLRAVELDVEGVGWRTELRLERLMADVLGDGRAQADPVMVEDAILILREEMIRQGYLYPEILYNLEDDGWIVGFGRWSPLERWPELPWERADRVVFRVLKGERHYFAKVQFEGLREITADDARAFFYPSAGLFITEGERAYSPGALNDGMNSLRRRLAQLGFLEARVELGEEPAILPDGAVEVQVRVDNGPRYFWGDAQVEGSLENVPGSSGAQPQTGTVFTEEGLQDWIVSVRNRCHVAGYPWVRVQPERTTTPQPKTDAVRVDVTLRVQPGERARLGAVSFSGLKQTSEEFVRSVVDLETGEWLDRLEVDAAQFDLGRLGVFRRTRAEIRRTPEAPETADVHFSVEERERLELNALFGYGSYERFRIGLEGRTRNLFGRAHSAQVRVRQSMRSSAGLALYSVPRPLPGLERAQVRLQGLRREEISFNRQEGLIAAGVERGFFDGQLRTSLEYRYELLRSVDVASEELVGDTRATVGSLQLGLGWDTRDRVIAPREGGSVHAQFELASPALGADAHFQRVVIRSSLHQSFNHQRLRWHFGLEGGMLSRLGSDAFELPVNKRFFPGGENTVRGYKEGEASPLDSEGNEIGAEIYVLGHVEFEMQVLESLAVVFFTDGVWSAARLEQSGDGEALFSSGLGLRYTTPLGPLRLEYGHNLNPRENDPSGSLHLSIGFPF